MASEYDTRKDIIRICHTMHQKGFIAATDGNITVRIGDDRILATPSGINKGFISDDDLIITDMQGKKTSGRREPTSEISLHLAVYEVRPDVRCVVHAHPPISTAFSIAGIPLEANVVPEVIANLGSIPTTEYATPASPEGAVVIRKYIGSHDAVVLAHHGTVTVGVTVDEAYNKLEKVEHAATILLTARLLGNVRSLSSEQVAKLVHPEKGLDLKNGFFESE